MHRSLFFILIIALAFPPNAGALYFHTTGELTAGRNIDLHSGAGTHQRGSYVVSEIGSITYRTEGDLLLEAGKSTYSGKTTESTSTASAFFGTNGGSSVSAGMSKSKDSWSGTTWNNSGAYAEQGTVRFDVAGDMRAEGFNALGKHIVADVGGDLDLISRQNTSSSSGSSFGANAGFGFGAKDAKNPDAARSKNVSGGINQGKSNGDRAWADSTSSLVGTESVDISVGGNLGLSGSVIANIKDDGADGGNLRISAASLSFNDLQNHDEYENRGYGFSTSTGHSLPENAPPSGTTSISLTHQGHDTQGVTRSTIGRGAITVAGVNTDPAGLNRDLSKIDEITSDKITGALDATMNIDNRVFTGAGWASIASDVTNFGTNLIAAAEGAGKGAVYSLGVVGDVLASIGETFTGTAGLDPTNLPKLVAVKVGVQQVLAELPKTCPKCVEWINGKNFDPDELADIEKIVNETARIHGLSMKEFKLYAMPDDKGGIHNADNGGSVALNILNRDGSGFSSGEQRVSSFGHEAGGHNSGIVDGECFANLMGRYAVGAMDLSNWLNGNERTIDAGSAADWLAAYGSSDYVKGNNAFADDLRKKEGTQYDSLYDHSKRTVLNDLANGFGLISDEKAAENRRVNDAKLLVQAEKITDVVASVNGLIALSKDPKQQLYLAANFDKVIALGVASKKEEFDRMMVELGSSDPVVAARAQARLEAGIERISNEALFTVVTAGDGAILSALARGGELIKDLKLAKKAMAAEVDAVKVAGKIDDIAKAAKSFHPLDLVETHGQTMSNKQLAKLMQDIKENGIKEPIKIIEYEGSRYVVDGHHRLIVAKKLGIRSVPVEEVSFPYKGYKSPDDFFK